MFSVRPFLLILWMTGVVIADSETRSAPAHQASPIFSTKVPHATKDKPQSKLWFAHGRWWAWLPVTGGSTVLERGEAGWNELKHLRGRLAGLPGQADVLSTGDRVRAVLVAGNRLAVIDLGYDVARRTYEIVQPHHEWAFQSAKTSKDGIETATIVHDSKGVWWVSFDREESIWIVGTTDPAGYQWGTPQSLGGGIKSDDLGAAFALGDRVGVIWSDQNAEAVYFREHIDGQGPDRWGDRVIVEQGGKTADDHFNGAVASDGTLFVATKNSVDRIGSPQLVLRVRRPDGLWENHPYATRTDQGEPSRPIALLGGSPSRLHLLHTTYDRRKATIRRDLISLLTLPLDRLNLLTNPSAPILSASVSVNNPTGTKSLLPSDAPWIILASDAEGNIYEGQVPR